MNEIVNKKLPIRTKIGYSFGEIGSQCSWTLISSYLTVFYTDVVGMTKESARENEEKIALMLEKNN